MTTIDATREDKRRKRKAILASGIVLGVGAVITLAAWNDSVWGTAAFGTGDSQWNLEGSIDGGNIWDEFQEPGTAGVMKFPPSATGLIPGQTIAANYGVKEEFGKVASTVTLQAPTLGGGSPLDPFINVQVISQGPSATAPTCTAATTGTVVQSGKLNALTAGTTQDLPKGNTDAQWYCFKVTLDQAAPHGLAQTTNPNWEFKGVSVDAP